MRDSKSSAFSSRSSHGCAMPGGERGISEKRASLATLAAGLFYIGDDPDSQCNRALNPSSSSMKGADHLRTRSIVRLHRSLKARWLIRYGMVERPRRAMCPRASRSLLEADRRVVTDDDAPRMTRAFVPKLNGL